MSSGGPGPGRLGMALRRLDLSEGQREEIRAIFESERDSVQVNHEEMRALGAELEGQIEADPYDEEAVRAKAAGLAELRVEMAVLRARQLGQIREVLTPEQIDELKQMKGERKEFRNRRRERPRRFQPGEGLPSGAE